MKLRLSIFLFIISVVATKQLFGQNTTIIPGYTGYAIPAEDEEKNEMFSPGKVLMHWTDTKQSINYYGIIQKPGTIDISVNIKSFSNLELEVNVSDKIFSIAVAPQRTFKVIHIGKVELKDTGVFHISFVCRKKAAKNIAEIESLQLETDKPDLIFFNNNERRNAASVHLMYAVPDTTKAVAFYTELSVPKGTEALHSYYMACGFARGYFGMQINSPTERRIIFSVWDAGNEAVDRDKVADSNRVKLIAKGIDVIASDFGNEGTGGHSHWIYNWKADSTYKFLVTAAIDSNTLSTVYAAYFFAPELNTWKFIAAFRSPKDAAYLHHLYSFVEDFSGVNGQLYRKAIFGNQWLQNDENDWQEITKATFSCDATGKAKDRIDFGGGTQRDKFYLWNGGFHTASIAYGDSLKRTGGNEKPLLNLYHHADSSEQAVIDKKIILKEIAQKHIDTTGSINGIYYNILKAGTGNNVSVSDTVSVFYKLTLLKDTAIIAQTDALPATFPLNNLIKGWQLGLPLCKVGGKIRLIIPSGLAYSIRNRAAEIPPNSILVFDITVLDVKKQMLK